MLYFAYGSNLNHSQMEYRCPNAKYIKSHTLSDYKLCFSHKTNNSIYGHANIIKSKNSYVPGALWKITKNDEKELDKYEGVDYNYYSKHFFYIKRKKVLVYIQNVYYLKKPNSAYLHTIVKGYKNCELDIGYLKRKLLKYNIKYNIDW